MFSFCVGLIFAAASNVCYSRGLKQSIADELYLDEATAFLQVSKHVVNGSHRVGLLESKPKTPFVCILARICGSNSSCAPDPTSGGLSNTIVKAFLASVAAQTYPSWELHLLNGPGGGEVYTELLHSFGDARLINGPSSPVPFSSNTYGYEATNYALQQLDGQHCDYYLFTNADNLYGRHFLEIGLPGMKEGYDLLGFNFVSKYPHWNITAHSVIQKLDFKYMHIDLGAALVSAQAIQADHLTFRLDLEHESMADYRFFDDILHRPGSKGFKLYEELQFIHQLQVGAV